MCGGLALVAQAQEDASLTIVPLSGSGSGPFTYQATLTDTGTTDIGSVWYAWTPGFNYLPSRPTSASGVTAGWTTTIPANSIQFVGGSLTPGQSAVFDFTTADSPTALEGTSGGTPIGTSVAYSGGLFSDGGVTFVANVASAPEPSSLALLAASGAGWVAMRLRRRV